MTQTKIGRLLTRIFGKEFLEDLNTVQTAKERLKHAEDAHADKHTPETFDALRKAQDHLKAAQATKANPGARSKPRTEMEALKEREKAAVAKLNQSGGVPSDVRREYSTKLDDIRKRMHELQAKGVKA